MNKVDSLVSKVTQLLTDLRFFCSSATEKKKAVVADLADVVLATDDFFEAEDVLVMLNAAVLRKLEAYGKPGDYAKADKLRLALSSLKLEAR